MDVWIMNTNERQNKPGLAPGFSLIELMIALTILTIGLLGVLALFMHSMVVAGFSEQNLIAKQKAREAIESIFTARNTAQISFDQIQNTSVTGGIFVEGFQPLSLPGNDGLVGTADDTGVETMVTTANDGSPTVRQLDEFERRIQIQPVTGSSDYRQVTVTVRYGTTQRLRRDFQLLTYVSRFR
jgi:prepilin-type N-terminal cleavage/methylation domain-containing protein